MRPATAIAVVTAVTCTLMLPAAAPMPHESKPQTGFLFESIEAQGRTYDYAVYVPRAYDPATPTPMILFLHGSGESGTDGQRQLAVGLGPRVLYDPQDWPFIVLFPQKPTVESQWEDHLDAVKSMMDRARREYNVDPSRIYLTGLSQGGHGVWTFAAAMPDTFAALAPICGYVEVPNPPRGSGRQWSTDPDSALAKRVIAAAKRVPVRAFHGGADDVVPNSQTRFIVKAIQEAGGHASVTVYPGVGHDAWDRAYGTEGLGEWLLGQRRPPDDGSRNQP